MEVNIEIRECKGRDIKSMKGKLRKQDIIEIEKMTGRDPYQVLVHSYRKSEVAYVGLIDGEIACAWGVSHESILADAAHIWLLSTPVMERAPVPVARRTRKELKKILNIYPCLENYVDAEYTMCVKWLKWLGFTVEKPEKLGVANGMFSHFYIDNKKKGR